MEKFNILKFNDLNSKGVTKQLKKVEKFLQNGDFKSAEVKKLSNTNFFRAKLDYENRLLFQFSTFNNKNYILLLEVILNHEYEKSKFLRGKKLDESKLKEIKEVSDEDLINVSYINEEKNYFHFLDKVISFDNSQDEILHYKAPLIVIGSAGSGKTALTLEKLKTLNGNVLYISISEYLVENSQNLYYSNKFENPHQEVEFLSFNEFIESIEIPKTKEVTFREFENWFNRHKQSMKIRESYKIFEEFKGVITGSIIDKSFLPKEEYLKLGIKQSIFTDKEKEEIYSLFEKYLVFLKENFLHDINILSHSYLDKVDKRYDFIVVDEVQDLTNIQLFLILQSLKKELHFILSGDSNQIVHPNFFSWSNLKTLLFKTSKSETNIIKILQTNYRNSPTITELSNRLLKIKNYRFGSIDKESTYLINSISKKEGEVHFFKENDKIKKELNTKTAQSTKFAILVMNNSDKEIVKKFFKTPLIFSIQEAKGLEYENIILINFISSYDKEFREITSGVEKENLNEDLKFSRTKDKSNKELEVYKFYINSLYVAFTRAIENLYILENSNKHKLLELLSLIDSDKKLEIKTQKSSEDEWQKEANKLKKQGKIEQYEAIEKELNKNKKVVKRLSKTELEELKKEALNPELFNKKAKDTLFEYAKSISNRELLNELIELKYKKAEKYLQDLERDFNNYYKACKENNLGQIKFYINKYGLEYSNSKDLNGLMVASMYGVKEIIEFFLEKGLDKNLVNDKGLNALSFAILNYTNEIDKSNREEIREREIMKDNFMIDSFNEFDVIKGVFDEKLTNSYQALMSPSIKCKIDNKMVKIYSHSMEYFLLNYYIALRDKILSRDYNKKYKYSCLNMDEFLEYIQYIPDEILPEYRKKRQYINSILAKNEIDRDDIYNKKLFKRLVRGCYSLNPKMEIL